MKITKIVARQILDSRGNPTVEADVWVDNGVFGRAAVPSGASTGKHEAHELRDRETAYNGLGVTQAVANITQEIAPILRGVQVDDQHLVDQKMIDLDGTPNKSRLGANAILAVSLATAHAAARVRNVLLYAHINDIAHNPKKSYPVPMMNVLNGGRHANGSSDFQEFMVIPTQATSFANAIQTGSEIFQALKQDLTAQGLSTAVGDEGGFTYPVKESNMEMLDLLTRACISAGYKPGENVSFGLDVAASEFLTENGYELKNDKKVLSSEELIDYMIKMSDRYPVISIEDALAEDDWDGWASMTEKLGRMQLVGDDLLVTNPSRLERAIHLKAGNAILIKPNQIGTLTETIHAIKIAHEHNWRTIISHRSGETEDTTIAHLAIGTGAGQIKTGSLSRSERTAKHNEIMRIESIDGTIELAKPF